MTIALLFFGILSLLGIVTTVVVVARDGYRSAPRRESPDFDAEARFVTN
ncbi:hypothetical protein ACEXOS_016720 [Herbiconiux sp. P16]